MVELNTDITKISRVGLATAKKLKKLGAETVHDLLFYFPYRYDDFSQVVPISELKPGMSANIVGQIELIQNKRSPRRRMYITEALVSDETESIRVVWFNQPFIAKNLRAGDRVSLAGKIEEDYGGEIMKSPVYEKINPPRPPACPAGRLYQGGNTGAVHTQGLVPNYHLTADITQKQIRFLIKQIIGLADFLVDWLPQEITKNNKFLSIKDAVRKVHFPKNQEDIKNARQRIAFDELFLLQIRAQLTKLSLSRNRAPEILFKEKETKKFVDNLPFKLTNDQRRVAWDILQDIERDKPMTRLLEGDVGSGKTIVAVIAMLNTALNGKQAVLMVPTEILARQHFDSIGGLLNKWGIKIGLITRSNKEIINYNFQSKNKNDKTLEIFQNADIIIGTHTLVQDGVKFKDLALVIVDEQHRFGVEQRAMLVRSNALTPHFLSMTATPIPRSLAMTIYGDLDISVIKEMPKDRKKIITRVVEEKNRAKAYQFIRDEIKKGRQAFVVCPLIDFSDLLGVKSVKEEYEKLNKIIFPDLKIGMLHGKMPARRSERVRSTTGMSGKSKEEVMQDFFDNKINILISTSVVEVGVDVPNATIMMIEGADRFGLAQLHQSRGRVGRAEHQSYCLLFTDSDSPNALNRLTALVNNDDGFALAKMDLKFRGPGEVYGTLQKGFPELKMASLFDYELMKQAKEEAEKILRDDSRLSKYSVLKEKAGEIEEAHLE